MDEQKHLKLLVVDDEEGIVDYMKKIYDNKGYITFSATDGAVAVEIFKKESPQISLIDVHMPYSPIDGIETLRQIREIDKDSVCIMVTRITEQDKVEAAKKAGAFAYLLKPLTAGDIDKVINEAREKFKF